MQDRNNFCFLPYKNSLIYKLIDLFYNLELTGVINNFTSLAGRAACNLPELNDSPEVTNF
jgi:hypothetical protein